MLGLFPEVAQGEAQAQNAALWANRNWESFCKVMHHLEAEAAKGNPRLTRSDVLAWARSAGVEMGFDEFKRDHNLYPALARYMVMMKPRLKSVLHFRGAHCDHADMGAVWREVNPQHPLAVGDWRAA